MNPVLIALDLPDLGEAEPLARRLQPHVGGFKVGLELMMSEGPEAISRISALGLPVFVDAKLHDIPNTAAGAARALSGRGARWVTAHASGGRAMLEAVADALGDRAGLLAVSVLTSLADADLAGIGAIGPLDEQVRLLSVLAHEAGAEGMVCAVDEVQVVKGVSAQLLAVTPGIRFDPSRGQDQQRVATPEEAVAAGADLLVVGRSVTRAADPVQTAIELGELVERTRPV